MYFLKITPEDIAVGNLITTVVLICITAYYAFITHKIQHDQSNHFELTHRPYLSFEKFELGFDEEDNVIKGVQPKLFLKNVGNVILKFNVHESNFTINSIPASNIDLVNSGGYIFPQMNSIFYYPSEKKFNHTNLKSKNEGVLKYKISYNMPGSKKNYISEKTLVFNFSLVRDMPFAVLYKDQKET